jgi:hypothetical protein
MNSNLEELVTSGETFVHTSDEVTRRVLAPFNAFLRERIEQGLPLVITGAITDKETSN